MKRGFRSKYRHMRKAKRQADLRCEALHREYVGVVESNVLLRRQIVAQDALLRELLDELTEPTSSKNTDRYWAEMIDRIEGVLLDE